MQDYNKRIIEEFRTSEGKVGGPFAGVPIVIVTSKGAKSGRPHTTPLAYLREREATGGPGDRIYVFGSMGGAPKHPAWYFNLKANPDAAVEVGTERYPVRAEVLTGAERDRVFEEQASRLPQFRQYQQRTKRVIPVIALERIE